MYWDLVALPLVLGAIGAGRLGRLGDGRALSGRRGAADLSSIRGICRNTRCARCCGWWPRWSPRWSSASSTRRWRRRAGSAEKILIPVLDILQSVPILGFLSITVTGFIALFPGSLLGYECAAIFAIFTSQAWNMTFSLYQSLRTVPRRSARGGADVSPLRLAALLAARSAARHAAAGVEHDDVGVGRLVLRRRLRGDHASPARRSCCRASAPTSRSRSTSAISARSATPSLAMLVVILLYDQLLFRPLLAWSREIRQRRGRRRGSTRGRGF